MLTLLMKDQFVLWTMKYSQKNFPFNKSISDLQLLYPRNVTNAFYLLLRA